MLKSEWIESLEFLANLPVNLSTCLLIMPTRCMYFDSAKLLQKSEMRKDIVIELSYKGFG